VVTQQFLDSSGFPLGSPVKSLLSVGFATALNFFNGIQPTLTLIPETTGLVGVAMPNGAQELYETAITDGFTLQFSPNILIDSSEGFGFFFITEADTTLTFINFSSGSGSEVPVVTVDSELLENGDFIPAGSAVNVEFTNNDSLDSFIQLVEVQPVEL
jgi:hypothetical protein